MYYKNMLERSNVEGVMPAAAAVGSMLREIEKYRERLVCQIF